MNTHPSDQSVHVTGEERLHPALRKLGRACIALARWQRKEAQRAAQSTPATDGTAPPSSASVPLPAEAESAASDQEHGNA